MYMKSGICSKLGKLNIKIYIKYLRSVHNKLTETKKPLKNLFISHGGHKYQLACPFATASKNSHIG